LPGSPEKNGRYTEIMVQKVVVVVAAAAAAAAVVLLVLQLLTRFQLMWCHAVHLWPLSLFYLLVCYG